MLREAARPPGGDLEARVRALGPWFHNLDLHGVRTAPEHFLGDYPSIKWQRFQGVLPDDLTGRTVLDIGCNGGFYAIEMKRRGADRVVAIDHDPDYLAQARLASEVLGLEIELRQASVYDVGALGERFDLVLFMGVLYHLRHPLLALDLIHEHVAADLVLFQSMQRGSEVVWDLEEDYGFWNTDIFHYAGFPAMYFIEQRYAGDPSNWWIPNRACTEGMLRSAGFEILQHPEDEVYLCRRVQPPAMRPAPPMVFPAGSDNAMMRGGEPPRHRPGPNGNGITNCTNEPENPTKPIS
jgi:tRNA (mo5U34)-methyltransferase